MSVTLYPGVIPSLAGVIYSELPTDDGRGRRARPTTQDKK